MIIHLWLTAACWLLLGMQLGLVLAGVRLSIVGAVAVAIALGFAISCTVRDQNYVWRLFGRRPS